MPTIQPPPLSHALLKTIERAEAMHVFIQTHIPQSFILDTTKVTLFVSLFSLAEEHHQAILLLLRTGQLDGSAFALVRPLLEACLRAHWINSCAKPATLDRIEQGGKGYPPFPDMAGAVEKKLDASGFFTNIADAMETLHGFTHGGVEQLSRRFSPDGNLKPDYTDEEKQEVINVITAHFTNLAIAWCEPDAGRTISDKYRELYVAEKQ